MARIIRFHELGGPEVLRIEEEPPRLLASEEVRINVRAIGLNRADVMFRRGTYLETAVLPSRLGYEASGIVDAVGQDVKNHRPGDEVSVIPPIGLGRYGTYGETAVLPARHIVANPTGLSFADAASVWMQFLVAYGGLIELARLIPGETVLITAASSSVGIAAIQMAIACGAVPIATTLSGRQREALLALGAPHVIALEETNLLEALAKFDPIRVVFDAVGGPDVEVIARAMAPGGLIVSHGALSGGATPFPLKSAIRHSLSMHGYNFMRLLEDDAMLDRAKRFILAKLEDGALRPVIDRTFAFEDIVEAHRFLEGNSQLGKIVVTVA